MKNQTAKQSFGDIVGTYINFNFSSKKRIIYKSGSVLLIYLNPRLLRNLQTHIFNTCRRRISKLLKQIKKVDSDLKSPKLL